MHDTVTLISQDISTDEIGQEIRHDAGTVEILCRVSSVTRTEWSAAYQNNIQAEWVLNVFYADYHGERIAVFRGKRYLIYRTFANEERMELYLGERVGENI